MLSSEVSAGGAIPAEFAVHGRQVSCRQSAGRQICTSARRSARTGCILCSPATQAMTQRNAGQVRAQVAVPQGATLRVQLPLGLQLDSYPSLGGKNVLVTGDAGAHNAAHRRTVVCITCASAATVLTLRASSLQAAAVASGITQHGFWRCWVRKCTLRTSTPPPSPPRWPTSQHLSPGTVLMCSSSSWLD